jgi:hypothetical protein
LVIQQRVRRRQQNVGQGSRREPANAETPSVWFTLKKLPPGPAKMGPVSRSVQSAEVLGYIVTFDHCDDRPAVGEQMLVGANFRIENDTSGVRITSPVARILTDEPNCVVFETESGSTYEWTCGELH